MLYAGTGLNTVAMVADEYGTFTIPIAQRLSGHVTALDIEREMIDEPSHKAQHGDVRNMTA